MRTLVIDIETSPNVVDRWDLFSASPVALNQLHTPTRMICFAAMWADSNKVVFSSEFGSSFEDMVVDCYELLDEADAVVGWNSDRFDRKKINTEFIKLGMAPPAPYKSIDLLRTVKNNFAFPSNKLDYVASALGHGRKLSTGGHELWTKCLAGDAKAWKLMEKYNKQDVVLTKGLYWDLLPWISGHPNLGLYNGIDANVCPNCGSQELAKRGFSVAETGRYQRYCCTMCGRWSRSTARESAVQIRGI